jgi:hypothetical protein
MNIIINPLLKSAIPPLRAEELTGLEVNILRDGCRDPLVTWNGTLVDGHNRYEICIRHGLPFRTVEMDFESINHARVWMRNNQTGKRNATPAWLIECALENKADLLEIGKASRKEKMEGNQNADHSKTVVFQNNTTESEPVSTRAEIAKIAGVSESQLAKGEQVKKKDPALWEKAKAGEVSIAQAYKAVTPPKEKPAQAPTAEAKEEPEPLVVDGTHEPQPEPGVAMVYARTALDALNKIPRKDPSRQGAIEMIRQWLELNNK